MDVLEKIDLNSFDSKVSKSLSENAIRALELGKVIFLPELSFSLTPEELLFLNPNIVDSKSKNISYNIKNDRLSGTICEDIEAIKLKEMIRRFSLKTRAFMDSLFPYYTSNLIQARTSFRPVEAKARIQSYKKDDTRLHVDSFPASPTKGERIIRFFTNVNANGKPRVWRLGEPFNDVVQKIGPRTSKPIPALRSIMQAFGITKDYRTLYDHYMLQIHDEMKRDLEYQKTVPQQEVLFPPGSSWIVYSDQVSHAAMSGQHLFEQTFHLPVNGMGNPDNSPLKIMESYYGRELI